MESNQGKKSWTILKKRYKKLSEYIRSDNFDHCKVGRAITLLGAIGNGPILQKPLNMAPIIILYFWGTIDVFADCISECLKNLWGIPGDGSERYYFWSRFLCCCW